MRFVKLTDERGNAMLVNPEYIAKVVGEGQHTVLHYAAQANLYSKSEIVKESFDKTLELLDCACCEGVGCETHS